MNRKRIAASLITFVIISSCGLFSAVLLKLLTGRQDIAMMLGLVSFGIGLVAGLFTLFTRGEDDAIKNTEE